MDQTPTPSKPSIKPFASRFIEKRNDFPSASFPYSDTEQVGVWEIDDVRRSPLLMSPTSYKTSNGDGGSDESH